jgi:hypothetical protein
MTGDPENEVAVLAALVAGALAATLAAIVALIRSGRAVPAPWQTLRGHAWGTTPRRRSPRAPRGRGHRRSPAVRWPQPVPRPG